MVYELWFDRQILVFNGEQLKICYELTEDGIKDPIWELIDEDKVIDSGDLIPRQM